MVTQRVLLPRLLSENPQLTVAGHYPVINAVSEDAGDVLLPLRDVGYLRSE